MITVPLRELRNSFSKLEIWLHEGESIQIKKRRQLIALLTGLQGTSATAHKKLQPAKPDFAALRKAIWKGHVFTPEEVIALRNDELDENK